MYCDNGLSAYLGYQVSVGHEKRVAREGRGLDPREDWNSIQGQRLRFILYPWNPLTLHQGGGHGAIH